MSRAKLDPLHAAALVSTGLLALYGPLYLAFCGARLARLPAADFAVHAVFQGLLVTIISVVLDARAIVILGASAGAAFGARVPVFAIPLLGEWPSGADWARIVVISAGVFLATGGAREPPGMIVPAAISACGKDG